MVTNVKQSSYQFHHKMHKISIKYYNTYTYFVKRNKLTNLMIFVNFKDLLLKCAG